MISLPPRGKTSLIIDLVFSPTKLSRFVSRMLCNTEVKTKVDHAITVHAILSLTRKYAVIIIIKF